MLTNDEIVANLSNKASKQEVEALSRQIADLMRFTGADQYYKKPEDGIPKSDLSVALQSKITEIDNKYTIGEAIDTNDLPANIPTNTDLTNATHGIQNTTMTANRIIDEVMSARDGKASLKANIDLRAYIASIIDTVNSSTEMNGEDPLLIEKAKVEVPDHQELTGRTGAAGKHAIGDITDLSTTLGTLVVAANVLAAINASEETTKIDPDQIDVESITHNDLTGRDTAAAHPISAIDGLGTVLTALQGEISNLESMATGYGWIAAGGKSALQVMLECWYTALASLLSGIEPPCWPTSP